MSTEDKKPEDVITGWTGPITPEAQSPVTGMQPITPEAQSPVTGMQPITPEALSDKQ